MERDFREVATTEATGGPGSEITSRLQRFAPPSQLDISVRTPGKVVALSRAGIRARRGGVLPELPARGVAS
jgi:hypothetical protein